MPIAGGLACLTSALLWAVALTIFREPIAEHGARTVNTAKCVLAAALQGITVFGLGYGGQLSGASLSALALLSASGVIGLTVGDTALFSAVARIGVHRTLLLQTLAPVFAAIVEALWQGTVPGVAQLVGASLILLGVALVVAPPRVAPGDRPRLPREIPGASWAAGGIALGATSALCQGSGVVLAKVGMLDVPFAAASFVRLAAAAAGLVLLAAASGRLARIVSLARAPATPARVVPATLLGTYLAMFLMMAGIAWVPASIAAVLLSTSPVFSLVIEAVIDKRPITPRGLAGTLLAVLGVAVLTSV